MTVTVNQKALSFCLNELHKVTAKTIMHPTHWVFLCANEGQLTLYGTDCTISERFRLECSGTLDPCCVNIDAFRKALPKGGKKNQTVDLSLSTTESKLDVKVNGMLTKLPLEESTSFPNLQSSTGSLAMDTLNSAVFSAALDYTCRAKSGDYARAIAHLHIPNGRILHSTDGHRLAQAEIGSDTYALDNFFIVSEAANALNRILPSSFPVVEVGYLDQDPRFKFIRSKSAEAPFLGFDVIYSVLDIPDYPDVDKVFPTDFSCHVALDREQLKDVISNLSKLVKKDGAVTFTVDKDNNETLRIKYSDYENSSEVSIPMVVTDWKADKSIVFNMNPRYILDAISADYPTAYLAIPTDSCCPVIFRLGSCLSLVMPVRL